MKNIKLSLLAIALFALFSVTLTSCGDESEDPKPVQKTDLELVKENIVGVTVMTTAASVNGINIPDLCDQSATYKNSVEHLTFKFTTATSVNVKWNCPAAGGMQANANYVITQNGETFNVKITDPSISTGNVILDVNFNKADFVDGNKEILPTIKGIFKELGSPNPVNWVGSPLFTLEKQ